MSSIRSIALSIFCFLLAGGVACAGPAEGRAEAVLVSAAGEKIGTAAFKEVPGGVRVVLKVSKLPPGSHAFHIHSVGKCDPPDFKSAGPHFNPTHKKHGRENPEGQHAGDLPNLPVGQDGTGELSVLVPGITLSGTAENALFHPGGTAVVIHASPDDNKTDPAGNAGDRIACGIVTQF